MKNIIFITISVHLLYFLIWFFTNKIRNSHLKIVREWDNGYEFYEILSPIDKEKYWKEDTKNLNYFFCVLLFFMEIMFYCFYKNWTFLWILSLIIGLITSSIVYIVLDMKLKKKYITK